MTILPDDHPLNASPFPADPTYEIELLGDAMHLPIIPLPTDDPTTDKDE